uniref:Protein kinase domain-containing protein n=1 Tax=Ananas comosus var. bracteatus TaxID=296719 RepID=A0A6V7PD62_ANACO|nr:unnamed protein product [Ananas comosus var. bracteatus]
MHWRGAFGAVSLAAEANTGEVFAVKTVDLGSASKESVYSIENEIEILRSIDSPLRGGGHGGELAERRKGLEEAEVRGYARRAARALRYLHDDAGVVHCDVKGRNLLAGRAPSAAKLADFGSAIRVSEAEAEAEGGAWGCGCGDAAVDGAGGGARGAAGAGVGRVVARVRRGGDGDRGAPVGGGVGARRRRRGGDAPDRVRGRGPAGPARISKLGRDFLDKCLRRDPAERWSCDRLLRHPFLAEDGAAAASWPSPRSVLDWGDFELNGEIDDGDEASSAADCDSDLDSSKLIDRARERVRDLASGAGFVDWRSDRDEDDDEEDEDEDEWEMVRRGRKGRIRQGNLWIV